MMLLPAPASQRPVCSNVAFLQFLATHSDHGDHNLHKLCGNKLCSSDFLPNESPPNVHIWSPGSHDFDLVLRLSMSPVSTIRGLLSMPSTELRPLPIAQYKHFLIARLGLCLSLLCRHCLFLSPSRLPVVLVTRLRWTLLVQSESSESKVCGDVWVPVSEQWAVSRSFGFPVFIFWWWLWLDIFELAAALIDRHRLLLPIDRHQQHWWWWRYLYDRALFICHQYCLTWLIFSSLLGAIFPFS